MNIAVITITYNDDYKFKEWVQNYQEHQDVIYKHIIVDNGSAPAYLKKVKSTFTRSVIIERGNNGGCTGAYNDGLKLAIQDPDVDAIMLLGNDIKLSANSMKALYQFLYSGSKLGMVAPILLKKDSNIIEDFGCEISRFLTLKPRHVGGELLDVAGQIHTSSTVTGGMNLAKKEFYTRVGLQDDRLFMYSDEVDMGLRAQSAGFEMGVTSTAISWHNHINPDGRSIRKPLAPFLIGRNKVYLAKKHFGFLKMIQVASYLSSIACLLLLKNITKKERIQYFSSSIWGVWKGLNNDMIIPEKLLS